MSTPTAVLIWIGVSIAAVVAFAAAPSLFSERELFAVLAVCVVGWFLIRRRRGLKFELSALRSRYRDSTEKSKLIAGVVLLFASFVWIVVALPLISDTWAEVIWAAFGPALLLLVVGSAVFWLGIYRTFVGGVSTKAQIRRTKR